MKLTVANLANDRRPRWMWLLSLGGSRYRFQDGFASEAECRAAGEAARKLAQGDDRQAGKGRP